VEWINPRPEANLTCAESASNKDGFRGGLSGDIAQDDPFMRPISIIGGGLAGLSLAVGLRHAGVPVQVTEAGRYPRHRVCGEFISGLTDVTVDRLGIAACLTSAVTLRHMRWYDTRRLLRADALPEAARGLSRWALDQRLADDLVELGGELQTGVRAPRSPAGAGQVDCAGRQAASDSRWMGLKCHLRDFALEADLEMHMSPDGYVGLSRIEAGQTNLCGLFRNAGLKPQEGRPFIFQYLERCGFGDLLARLESATPVAGSECAVAALSYERAPAVADAVCLGDARGLIPPFTGNGMTLAFESAALAVEPLRAFSSGAQSWEATTGQIADAAGRRFGRRLTAARWVHHWLMSPRLFPLTAAAARTPLFPFQGLFRLTR
jgi:flavin-dependent dehydrogenase